jgi:acetoin:2,6-dichlorophenolindophenol oxidoreductase subunit beta
VAWSSFQTGANPGKHNIFDFLTRDRRTYQPKLSSVEIRGPRRHIRLGKYLLPLGKADIKRAGHDVTVVAASRMVHQALAAAKTLAEKGIDVEVVDLRTISPLDKETIFASVEKTAKLVVAHEAVKAFGIGAEIAAMVAEEMIDRLDAPVVRVGAPFVPVPFNLEKEYLPAAADIVTAVEKVMAY